MEFSAFYAFLTDKLILISYSSFYKQFFGFITHKESNFLLRISKILTKIVFFVLVNHSNKFVLPLNNFFCISLLLRHLLSVNQFFSTVTICSTPSPTGTIPGNLPPQHQARQQQRPQNGLEGIASGGNSQPNGCILRFGDLPAALLQPTSDATETFNLWQNWRLATGANLTQHYAALSELTNKGYELLICIFLF